MSEREKDVIRRLTTTVPQLTREERNYILGVADGLILAKSDRDAPEKSKELQEV